jgi:hypothetical protein
MKEVTFYLDFLLINEPASKSWRPIDGVSQKVESERNKIASRFVLTFRLKKYISWATNQIIFIDLIPYKQSY